MSMKKYLGLAFLIICSFGYSQDTLYKRGSNDIIVAKVLEISTSEIKYKRFDMMDGPMFIVNKNEIEKIKYQVGSIETFEVVAPKYTLPLNQHAPINSETIEDYNNKGKYLYQTKKIAVNRAFQVIENKNNTWKNKEIKMLIYQSKQQRTYQYISGFSGIGVGFATIVAMSATSANSYSYQNQINNTLGVAALGTLLVVGTQVLSKNFKNMHLKYANKAVDIYNKNILNP